MTKILGQIWIWGALFHTTQKTNNVGRLYPEFSRVSTLYRVGGGGGELREIFEKVALVYEGTLIQKLQKIMNTALLSQEILSRIVFGSVI